VIAVDTNILVYAFHADFPQHDNARQALTRLIAWGEVWGIPSPCIHEFLATVTRARYLSHPASIDQVLSFVRVLQESYGCFVLDESIRHFETLEQILRSSGVTGAKVYDARIAAICRDHGVQELWSADRDFGYFPWLSTVNPLVPAES